jgi:hypothetical protein
MSVQPPPVTGNQDETIDLTGPLPGLQLQRENADTEAVTALKARQRKLEIHRRNAQRYYDWLKPVAIFCMIILPFFIWQYHMRAVKNPAYLLFSLYVIAPAATVPGMRSRLRDLDSELQQVDFQIDLFSFEVSKRETRAEKLLRVNDIQLRRYYDLNLSQNRWVFSLGVVCIALGAAIIGATMYIVFQLPDKDDASKIITGVLGAVGAILTNFVAAIYLNMNKASSETLAAFHSRLVETHQLLLGNLLASRIEDNAKREDTLASLSLHLVPGKDAAGK